MDPLTISALIKAGTEAISRIWANPADQAREILKLKELEQAGDLAHLEAYVKITLAQLEINNTQAKHKSIFVAGGRPFLIWVGGFALAWSGIIHPILVWVWSFMDIPGNPPPVIESEALTAIVTVLLGAGGMRSFDKSKGVSKDSLR